jgi:tRNA(Arg) A34 adenosine deaminase TadA
MLFWYRLFQQCKTPSPNPTNELGLLNLDNRDYISEYIIFQYSHLSFTCLQKAYLHSKTKSYFRLSQCLVDGYKFYMSQNICHMCLRCTILINIHGIYIK